MSLRWTHQSAGFSFLEIGTGRAAVSFQRHCSIAIALEWHPADGSELRSRGASRLLPKQEMQ